MFEFEHISRRGIRRRPFHHSSAFHLHPSQFLVKLYSLLSNMNSIPPPLYGHRPIYEISTEVNEMIMGNVPHPYLYACEKVSHLTNTAKLHKSKLMLLSETGETLAQVFHSCKQGQIDSEGLRVSAIISLPAPIVCGITKSPYHLTRMSIALWQRNHERKMAEKEILDEILESLSLSLEVILKMLVRLRIETPENLKQQIQEKGFSHFLALGRLFEAYGSRFAPIGTIYLASRKVLQKEHCSGIARRHFDQIHTLKEDLVLLNLSPTCNLFDTSTALEQWFLKAVKALKGLSIDRNENHLTRRVLQRLCETRDCLPGLLSMEIKRRL
ncbi:hypothetical protein F5884DRAFT_121409 [Xylogone sp. PMI_703]|nr:hypothetical protein F5884DRAFT_121409 [Xylogone sp. PMI_703]